MKNLHYTLIFCALALVGCEPRPKACIDWEDTVEAGTTLFLESCSEDYDFLTWEFSDDRGYIADSVQRIFEDEESLTVTLTAYSDGGYRSDEVVFPFRTSYRYIDRMEIVGTSDFGRFRLNMAGGEWQQGEAVGEFTDSAPYILYVWPESQQIIESDIGSITVTGIRNGNTTLLANESYNFASYKVNPIIINTNFGLTAKVYWKFRD